MTANIEMIEAGGLDEETQRCLAAATRGTARMKSVVEDLLTMAAIADPQREFVPERVDLRQVLTDVAEECGPAAQARSQHCRRRRPRHARLVRRSARGAAPHVRQPRQQRGQVLRRGR